MIIVLKVWPALLVRVASKFAEQYMMLHKVIFFDEAECSLALYFPALLPVLCRSYWLTVWLFAFLRRKRGCWDSGNVCQSTEWLLCSFDEKKSVLVVSSTPRFPERL